MFLILAETESQAQFLEVRSSLHRCCYGVVILVVLQSPSGDGVVIGVVLQSPRFCNGVIVTTRDATNGDGVDGTAGDSRLDNGGWRPMYSELSSCWTFSQSKQKYVFNGEVGLT